MFPALAGPIGPTRYLLLARGYGQQKLEDLENVEENVAESATCVPCIKPNEILVLYYHL